MRRVEPRPASPIEPATRETPAAEPAPTGSNEDPLPNADPLAGDPDRPEGWNEASHGETEEARYDLVFALDRVHRLDLEIAPEDWEEAHLCERVWRPLGRLA